MCMYLDPRSPLFTFPLVKHFYVSIMHHLITHRKVYVFHFLHNVREFFEIQPVAGTLAQLPCFLQIDRPHLLHLRRRHPVEQGEGRRIYRQSTERMTHRLKRPPLCLPTPKPRWIDSLSLSLSLSRSCSLSHLVENVGSVSLS